MNDEPLVIRCRLGEREAVAELVRPCGSSWSRGARPWSALLRRKAGLCG